jgi:signal transduction histidine kinase
MLTIIVLVENAYYSTSLNSICLFVVLLLLIFTILYWWDKNIQHQYLSKLRTLELESLRQELAEKDSLIEQIRQENEAQARLIHKDNKLIPAMLNAVTEYLTTADADRGQALAHELTALAGERQGLLHPTAPPEHSLPLTHRAGIDAMLSYMKNRANRYKIAFDVKLHADFAQKFDEVISEADLTHLLSDLLENAIIATKGADRRTIHVHLGILDNIPTVEVSDSGIPFTPSVYQDLGLRKHSTHLDEGGSGIGLMDIWEIKRKTTASLHITEYAPPTTPYSKTIALLFDQKKHYLIQTYRPEELIRIQTRSDLYVLPLGQHK